LKHAVPTIARECDITKQLRAGVPPGARISIILRHIKTELKRDQVVKRVAKEAAKGQASALSVAHLLPEELRPPVAFDGDQVMIPAEIAGDRREAAMYQEIQQVLRWCATQPGRTMSQIMLELQEQLVVLQPLVTSENVSGLNLADIQHQWQLLEGVQAGSKSVALACKLRQGQLWDGIEEKLKQVNNELPEGYFTSPWEYLEKKLKYPAAKEKEFRLYYQFFQVWKSFQADPRATSSS